jgi:hypothetical protein
VVFTFELVFAEVGEIRWLAGELGEKVGGGDEFLAELFHEAFHAEDGIDGISDDGGIALSDETDIPAGDDSIVQSNCDPEGAVGFRPAPARGHGKQVLRDSECLGRAGLGGRIHPIGQHGVSKEFVDGTPGLLDHVARIPEPFPQQTRQNGLFEFFRHGGKSTDITDKDRGFCDLLADAVCAGGEGGIVAGFSFGGLMMFKKDFAIGDADSRAMVESAGRNHTPSIKERAIAAAKVHHLILKSIVAANDGVLARDLRAARKADGIVPAATDGGGIANFHFKGLTSPGSDSQTGSHI